MGMASSKHPLLGRKAIVIAGPTAVGKSALALKLCERLQGELISVDSCKFYASSTSADKPSTHEMRACRTICSIFATRPRSTPPAPFIATRSTAVEDVLSRTKSVLAAAPQCTCVGSRAGGPRRQRPTL